MPLVSLLHHKFVHPPHWYNWLLDIIWSVAPTYLPTHPLTHLPTYLPTHSPTYLPVSLSLSIYYSPIHLPTNWIIQIQLLVSVLCSLPAVLERWCPLLDTGPLFCQNHSRLTSHILLFFIFFPISCWYKWSFEYYVSIWYNQSPLKTTEIPITSANFFFLFQINAYNKSNTYIYHLLPPTYFSVCYIIFRETSALFVQEIYVSWKAYSSCYNCYNFKFTLQSN